MTVGVSGLMNACSHEEAARFGSAPAKGNAEVTPGIWVSIGADNIITIQFAATELGQGSMTSIPLVLAEEMDADWDRVRVETVNIHDPAYGNPIFSNMLYTSGSTAMMVYFDRMRQAGAQARKLLLNAAATEWNVPVSELQTEPSVVLHPATNRKNSYGDIAAFMKLPAQVPEVNPSEFKPKSAYRYLGKHVPRIDILEKSSGKAIYGIDVQIPGMVYASVLRAPVEGEHALVIDDSKTRAIDGVSDVVRLPDGVAVVGNTVEATQWGKAALEVTWSETSRFRAADSERDLDEYEDKARDLSYSTNTPLWQDDGNVDAAFAVAKKIVEATYRTDAAYHAQMEPMACTASVSADGKSAEIWVGTQTQSYSIIGAAELLGTENENITLHTLYSGGGFGRRVLYRQKYIDDALYVSRAIGRPVKVIWSREDDVKGGTFRPMAAQYLRAALDEDSNLVAWHQRIATPSVLEYMNPMRWEDSHGKDIVSLNGSQNIRYDVPNFRAEHIMMKRNSRLGAWRGVGTTYTKFASESFLDEVAYARGSDPLQFRFELCHKHPRSVDVLQLVADMADWSRQRQGTALGVALTGYGSGSTSASIAEVSLDERSGVIRVHRFWTAYDAGFIISPGNTDSQMESNAVFGIGNALKERITIKAGEVQQTNFHDYSIMRMAELPDIQVRAIVTDNPPSGVGELGIATTGAAIANAVFKLTGARVRALPLTPERVLAALRLLPTK